MAHGAHRPVLQTTPGFLSVGQAFLDTRRPGPTGRLGVIGIVIILVLVALPHLVAYRYGTILGETFARVFAGDELDGSAGPAGPQPGDGERINVLLVGVDAKRDRTAILTDTMMVASLDPVGRSVSLLSVPRDLVDTPLGNGDVFGPKLNSLLGYADRNPDAFPQGGMRALQDAVGSLLDIPIHYYAKLDFSGVRQDFIDQINLDLNRPVVNPLILPPLTVSDFNNDFNFDDSMHAWSLMLNGLLDFGGHGDALQHLVRIPQVDLRKFKRAAALQPFQVPLPAAARQIIPDGHIPSRFHEATGRVCADESGASSDENTLRLHALKEMKVGW